MRVCLGMDAFVGVCLRVCMRVPAALCTHTDGPSALNHPVDVLQARVASE